MDERILWITKSLTSEVLMVSAKLIVNEFENFNEHIQISLDYQIKNTSMKVIKLILESTMLSNKWNKIYGK